MSELTESIVEIRRLAFKCDLDFADDLVMEVQDKITKLEKVVDDIKTHFETSSSQSISYHRKYVKQALEKLNKAPDKVHPLNDSVDDEN